MRKTFKIIVFSVFAFALLLNVGTNFNGSITLGSLSFANTGTTTTTSTNTDTKEVEKWASEDVHCFATCKDGRKVFVATVRGCFKGGELLICVPTKPCKDVEVPKGICE